MLVYIDILNGKEVAGDSFTFSEPIPGVHAFESKLINFKEVEVELGPASAEGDEEDEGVEASEAKQVIDIVHSFSLEKLPLEKKIFKALVGSYFKKLMKKLDQAKLSALGLPADHEFSSDKKEAADEEAAKANELDKFERLDYTNAVAAIKSLRDNFAGVNKWLVEEVLKNFDDYEFYTCERDGEIEMDNCLVLPAKYVGEAPAPCFYVITNGCRMQKV